MPPYIPRKCPECGHRNNFDLAAIKQKFIDRPIYRSVDQKKMLEYPVDCQKCGEKFIIEVDDD